ncbi:hypothetical protein TGRUB_240755 [Toxoplasma gondii RUB]|uniref:Transmembrane protein n=1 Tax=Toxoplasma gondii RUB TaxID=935652 RepID=A0A086LT26_TOXGO|nr:hypothetical protein TGRUB_240755 [Toxoplasma gondii RUB]
MTVPHTVKRARLRQRWTYTPADVCSGVRLSHSSHSSPHTLLGDASCRSVLGNKKGGLPRRNSKEAWSELRSPLESCGRLRLRRRILEFFVLPSACSGGFRGVCLLIFHLRLPFPHPSFSSAGTREGTLDKKTRLYKQQKDVTWPTSALSRFSQQAQKRTVDLSSLSTVLKRLLLRRFSPCNNNRKKRPSPLLLSPFDSLD